MNLRKHIQKEINRILSESDYLPLGAEYIKDAPYNQSETDIRIGKSSKENKYSSAWYGYNAGFSILKDSNGKLYAFYYSGIDKDDFEPYTDREVVGYDEDGPQFGDLELDGDTLARYANDNLNSLTFGIGKKGEIDGKDIISIDQEWKEGWLDYANKKGLQNNNKEFIKVLSNYNPVVNESLEVDSDSEEFLNVYLKISKDAEEKFINELKDDMEYVKNKFFDGEFPASFKEFYDKFKGYSFDNHYKESEVKEEFEKLTTNPNQLSLFESKMPNEDFVKVVFEYDFPSNENRLKLINIIKDYFGEPLSKGRDDKYWSTYIPKLELEDFMFEAQDFNPHATKEIIKANRFKPLTKGLKDGDIVKFFDYTVSENDPPRAEGYLKPGFIQRNRSLLKWNGGSKEAWIDNSMIDKYYFYHGDVSDIKNHPGSRRVDSDYVKIFFDDSILDSMNAEQEDELRKIITNHKGQLRYVFGRDRASGGQRYTLVPQDMADDFIQAAYDFGAYEAETERNIYLEDKALNEIRKIVRGVINSVIK